MNSINIRRGFVPKFKLVPTRSIPSVKDNKLNGYLNVNTLSYSGWHDDVGIPVYP